MFEISGEYPSATVKTILPSELKCRKEYIVGQKARTLAFNSKHSVDCFRFDRIQQLRRVLQNFPLCRLVTWEDTGGAIVTTGNMTWKIKLENETLNYSTL